VPAACIARFLQGLLLGDGRILFTSLWVIFKGITGLTVTIVIINLFQNVIYVSLSIAVIEWLALFYLWHRRPASSPTKKVSDKLKKEWNRLGRQMGWNQLLTESINRIDLLAAGLILSAGDTGVYSLISHIARAPLLVSQSYNRILLPQLRNLHSGHKPVSEASYRMKQAAIQIMKWVIRGAVLLMLLLITGFYYLDSLEITKQLIFLCMMMFSAFAVQAGYGVFGNWLVASDRNKIQLVRLSILLFGLMVAVPLAALSADVGGVCFTVSSLYILHALSGPVIAYNGVKHANQWEVIRALNWRFGFLFMITAVYGALFLFIP
jgi:hypothetical protein